MGEIELREGTLAELSVLAELHAQCFVQPWDAEFLGALLAQPHSFFILAREQNRPIGFVIARAVAEEAEIHSLGVAPDRRKQGIGEALLRGTAERALARGATTIFLEVSLDNGAALALYARVGFSEAGRRPGYYRDSLGSAGDALILRRALPL